MTDEDREYLRKVLGHEPTAMDVFHFEMGMLALAAQRALEKAHVTPGPSREEIEAQLAVNAKARKDRLIEALANVSHQGWCYWTRGLVERGKVHPDDVLRWRPQWAPYGELSESQKDDDRKWAIRYIEAILQFTEKEGW